MFNPTAVVGTGQTKYSSHRADVSTPELLFEATRKALDEAEMEPVDIEAVVFGSAPEVFEGVHEPDKWTVAGFGGTDKATVRIHTGGAAGGSAALEAARLVGSGAYDRVLVVALQRVGEAPKAQGIFTRITDPVLDKGLSLNVISSVALIASRQIALGRITPQHMDLVAAKNRQAGRLNPNGHLDLDIDASDVAASRMICWPIRLLHACPRSDGAAAAVIVSGEEVRHRYPGKPVAWVKGLGAAADTYRLGKRAGDGWELADVRALYWAAAKAYEQAGIGDPRAELDGVELQAPFANLEIASYEALGLCERGAAATLVEEEVTSLGGPLPFCASGGPMTSNPIGASGLIWFVEAADQVRGLCGDHQIDGARTMLASAAGGIHQFFSVCILGASQN